MNIIEGAIYVGTTESGTEYIFTAATNRGGYKNYIYTPTGLMNAKPLPGAETYSWFSIREANQDQQSHLKYCLKQGHFVRFEDIPKQEEKNIVQIINNFPIY